MGFTVAIIAKRHELSLQEKIEVLDKVKKQPHSSQRELAELFKIPIFTINVPQPLNKHLYTNS